MLFATASCAGTTGGWYVTILQCSVIAYRKELSLNNRLICHGGKEKIFSLLRASMANYYLLDNVEMWSLFMDNS